MARAALRISIHINCSWQIQVQKIAEQTLDKTIFKKNSNSRLRLSREKYLEPMIISKDNKKSILAS